MKYCKSLISGISGTALTAAEKAFITDHRPWGFILFTRNIENAPQLCALTENLRNASERVDVPIFIDQEGGRVQRLRPPLAPDYPAAAQLGALYGQDCQAGLRAAWIMSRLHAFDLQRYGLTADCLPVLDVPVDGGDPVIGTRAYSYDPQVVAQMGRAAACGLKAGGMLPVIKHIPGHGRATSDTHKGPARVDASLAILRQTDFAPFKALSDLPCAMVAHVVYAAVDDENPATLSRKTIETVIRGETGFDGLLMSDDLSMKALPGDIGSRARRALAAGCDMVLHCNGDMNEMLPVAENTSWLEGESLDRAKEAERWAGAAEEADEVALRAEFHTLLSSAIV